MFTPLESSLGALLIQAATSSYMHLEGKPIGFSSILFNSIFNPSIHSASILLGLFISSRFVGKFLPSFVPAVVPATLTTFPTAYLVAGLLVGAGTSAGCGCTSGHMLIGLSRLRWRSFVATCTFFLSAVITTLFIGSSRVDPHGVPNYEYDHSFTGFKENMTPLLALVVLGQIWSYVALPKIGLWLKQRKDKEVKVRTPRNLLTDNFVRWMTGISCGFLFGIGLFVAGMTDTTKIIGFLSFWRPASFDPSLGMIPLFCIVPNILLWKKWLPQTKAQAIATVAKDTDAAGSVVKKPLFESEYDLNFSNQTDVRFLLGNLVFGVGWALTGTCPGPGILSMFTELNTCTAGTKLLFVAGFLAGSFVQKHVPPLSARYAK